VLELSKAKHVGDRDLQQELMPGGRKRLEATIFRCADLAGRKIDA
jgi:hypothetical protein